jgi:AraC-like DNA-binding protein
MDVLSSVLSLNRIGSSIICQSDLAAPWGLDIHAEQKTIVHVVQRGVCWLRIANADPVRLTAGEIVLVGRGVEHTITHEPGADTLPWDLALDDMRKRLANAPAPEEVTTLLCAAYEFEQGEYHPLLSQMPRLVRLNIFDADAESGLEPMLRLLAQESRHAMPGAGVLVPRLVDALFVLIMRSWLMSGPAGAIGWFAALRDAQISRALSAIHDRPAEAWTVETLAAEAALSRAAFARRFAELVGEPPLSYLTRWRIGLAAKRLRSGNEPIDTLARDVGYTSAASFSKAFSRQLGAAPGRYRDRASSRPMSGAVLVG